MIEMFMSDYSVRQLECNTLMCDKICKHSKSLDGGGDPLKSPLIPPSKEHNDSN